MLFIVDSLQKQRARCSTEQREQKCTVQDVRLSLVTMCVRPTTDVHKSTEWGVTYKSSAVAEMGDRGHNRHGPKEGGGAAVPLSREL